MTRSARMGEVAPGPDREQAMTATHLSAGHPADN